MIYKKFILLSALWFSGCAIYNAKYQSDIDVNPPISERVKIDVKIGKTKIMKMEVHPGSIMSKSIKSAIYNDLHTNVFPNVVGAEPDALVHVKVDILTIQNKIGSVSSVMIILGDILLTGGGFALLYGLFRCSSKSRRIGSYCILIGSPLWIASNVVSDWKEVAYSNISLIIANKNGKVIKEYRESGKRELIHSHIPFYDDYKLFKTGKNSMKDAMEKIKKDINGDRDEIIKLIGGGA